MAKLVHFVLLLIGQVALTGFVDAQSSTDVTRILDNLLKEYDPRVRPNYGRGPVDVGVTLFIIGVHSVSSDAMDFAVDMYFRQLWSDPRLAYLSPGVTSILPTASFSKRLWTPDTFFVNEKTSSLNRNSNPNSFIRISPTGQVYQSTRIGLTARCPMNLRRFPFDRQACPIIIESYGSSMADIRYNFSRGNKSVGISDGLQVADYKVVAHRAIEESEILTSGNYSRLVVEIMFSRTAGYYIVQSFLPAAILVVLSWLPFWLSVRDVIARSLIGVISVVGLVALWVAANSSIARVSYVKAIDIYFIWCLLFAILALIEFVIARIINNRQNRARQTPSDANKVELNEPDGNEANVNQPAKPLKIKVANREIDVKSSLLDIVSRVAFPILFLAFVLIYWLVYCPGEEVFADWQNV